MLKTVKFLVKNLLVLGILNINFSMENSFIGNYKTEYNVFVCFKSQEIKFYLYGFREKFVHSIPLSQEEINTIQKLVDNNSHKVIECNNDTKKVNIEEHCQIYNCTIPSARLNDFTFHNLLSLLDDENKKHSLSQESISFANKFLHNRRKESASLIGLILLGSGLIGGIFGFYLSKKL